MRKIIFFTLMLCMILVSAANVIYATNKQKDDLIEIEGAIRNEGKGWELISDNAHESYGINSIEIEKDKIVIHHDLKAKKVRTMIVTADETMAKEGYTVGVSAGLDYSYIYIYNDKNNEINPKNYINKNGNIWIFGRLSK